MKQLMVMVAMIILGAVIAAGILSLRAPAERLVNGASHSIESVFDGQIGE